ncbi:MAG: hypothetical protein RL670_1187 [Actinomycetota bacterium]
MPKLAKAGNQNIAKDALLLETEAGSIGEFIEAIHDEEFVTSYLFDSKLKGYHGWRWSVTLSQVDAKHAATVSEILLMAGPESIVAPKWVPWSERLADYRALQAALDEQAKLAAEEAATESSEPDSEEAKLAKDVDSDEAAKPVESVGPTKKARGKKSAAAKVNEHQGTEGNADQAADEPPKRVRWLTRKKRH